MILNGVFERYADFPFIVAHTGGGVISAIDRLDWATPRWAKNLKRPASHYAKRLYYDTCAVYAPTLMEAHSAIGADHLMFGTDYPYIDIDFAHVNELPIAAAEKAAINGDTAAKIFKLG
jgi:aminocarboxymuconate-semialdehyde decarboxylase